MSIPGPASSSGELSASSIVMNMTGYLHGVELNPPSVGLATVKVWDSPTTSTVGKRLLTTMTCAAGQNALFLTFLMPRIANSGIYCELTGTTTYVVGYSLG